MFVHSVPPLKAPCPIYHEQWWCFTFHLLDIRGLALLFKPYFPLFETPRALLPGAQATFGTALIQLPSHLATLSFAVCAHLPPGFPATLVIKAILRELKAQHCPVQLVGNLTTKFSTWLCDEIVHFIIILAILLMLWSNILFCSTTVYPQ